jgi:signal transduction histidine kinase
VRDAITALEAALAELERARAELSEDLRTELDAIIGQAKAVLAALERLPTEDADQADETG